MGETTNISWADRTWSPWYGCTQISLGQTGACVGCYARQLSEIRQKRVVFGGPGRGIGTRSAKAESGWNEPLRWEREAAAAERAWFAGPDGGMGRPWPYSPFIFPSMCDPFDNHPDLAPLRRRFFDLIRATPHLTWLLLTKRPSNIIHLFAETLPPAADKRDEALRAVWPRNAAIGCTIVTQEEADRDVPRLLRAKAALGPAFAFVSMEPLMGPVDLTKLEVGRGPATFPGAPEITTARLLLNGLLGAASINLAGIDWVITGGETDQGSHKARPSHPQWFRDIRDKCAAAGVPFHHKQNGEWVSVSEVEGPGAHFSFPDSSTVRRTGKKLAGRTIDGCVHDARPAVPA